MKQSILGILALCLLAAFTAGCGSSKDDGPNFSDDDLLKRGQAGHNAASSPQSKTTPGAPGATTH